MNKVLISLSVLSVMAGLTNCSSGPKRDAYTYTIADSSAKDRPDWIEDFSKAGEKDDEYKYFVGEFENINKTLCQKGAKANAGEKIAEEVMRINYGDYTNNAINENDNVNERAEAYTKQVVNSNLGGIENYTAHWELKNFQTKMGADRDYKSYHCYAVVRAKKDLLDRFAQQVNEKSLKDVKEGTQKIGR